MNDRGKKSLLALGPVAAVLALCCGLPALLAAGGLAAAGGVLGACGSWPAAVILLALAGGLGVRWWTARRRGDAPRAASGGVPNPVEAASPSVDSSPELRESDRTAAGMETPRG
jgi:hypothetical protein